MKKWDCKPMKNIPKGWVFLGCHGEFGFPGMNYGKKKTKVEVEINSNVIIDDMPKKESWAVYKKEVPYIGSRLMTPRTVRIIEKYPNILTLKGANHLAKTMMEMEMK